MSFVVALLSQFRERRNLVRNLVELHRTWLAAPPTEAWEATKRPGVRQVQRRLDHDQVDELVVAYREGGTVREVADRFGVSRDTVMAHLEHRGAPRRQLVSPTEDQVLEAKLRYEAGQSLAVIGRELGFNAGTIRKYLVRVGVSTRPRPGY